MSGLFFLENKEKYLEARIVGEHSIEELLEKGRMILSTCIKDNLKQVIIDFSDFSGELSMLNRFKLGMHLATYRSHNIKLGVIASDAILDQGRYAEHVAKNRGADICVSNDRKKVENWFYGDGDEIRMH